MKKLLFLGLAALLLTGCLQKKTAVTTPEEKPSKVEEFTGNLLKAMGSGLPIKCDWQKDTSQATAYIKGKQMFIETTHAERTGYIILKDNCFWTWNKGEPTGMKLCSEPAASDENKFQGIDWSQEYNCGPAIFGDDKFVPPNEIKFTDLGEMMKGAGQ
ncbi:MAG: hypothetical protein NTZ93_02165 [Candidatus Beckwithbacteria bacterium]|nr:hypothetical protein [Candidatus Beckwithbacteria bacterium]